MNYYKVEGNIIYPNESMLTWGPFYYHSEDKAISRMAEIMKDIISWVNQQDPSLDIQPEDLIRTKNKKMIVFKIKAWKDEKTLQLCNGIIQVDNIFFEDE